jgi:serine O-acetyltransferase
MKNSSSESILNDFGLLSYLSADLIRARVLTHGTASNISGFRLWMGIFSPRFMPVLLCRVAYCLFRLKLGPLAKAVSLLNFVMFGIEIAVRCPIGKGLFFPHTVGTVIGAYAIGENVIIFQGVTLGAREVSFSYQESSRPVVGDDVIIGSGAKVLGGIVLGSGSRIGANAVVLDSVPSNVVAVGVPAKIVKNSF